MSAEAGTSHRQWVQSAIAQHERALLCYAHRLLGDNSRARDVVQETFAKLCEQSPGVLNGNLRPWLYTVCRSRVVDVRRKDKRMTLITDETVSAVRSELPGPADRAEQLDDLVSVTKLLTGLPDNQQEVLRLKFQHAMSYREIADIMGLSESNVGFLIHTGLKTIRLKMASDAGR